MSVRMVEIVFELTMGTDYSDVEEAFINQDLRLGIHVQSIDSDDNEGSKSFVTVVPIPGAVWLFGSGLLGLGWLSRNKTAKSG